jgi:hypothetical protein
VAGCDSDPNAEWLARQLAEAFGWDEPPRYLIRDRDGPYGAAFIRRIRAMGIRDRPVSARGEADRLDPTGMSYHVVVERTYRCRRTRGFGVMCAEQGAGVRRRPWGVTPSICSSLSFRQGQVGLVEPAGGGDRIKLEDQRHASEIADARQPEMRCPLPDDRAVQNASGT